MKSRPSLDSSRQGSQIRYGESAKKCFISSGTGFLPCKSVL